MNEYSFIAAIAGVLLVGAMSPGPSFLIVAKHSLGKSRIHGVATAVGTGLGVSLFAILASFGVTTLLSTVPNVFYIFKLMGGTYLLFLAWKIWSGATEKISELEFRKDQNSGLFKSFLSGLIVQTSNPKTALVIAGVFAAFVPTNPPPNTVILVALMAFIIDFSWYALVAIALSGRRSRTVYGKAKTGFDRTASVFLGIVGLRLLSTSL